MSLTTKQQAVLSELRNIARESSFRMKGKSDNLYLADLESLRRGDIACVFGMGGLTFQVGHRLTMKPGSVLSIFKALERKGLIIRETRAPEYQRALYWWPVGLAAELYAEHIKQQEQQP